MKLRELFDKMTSGLLDTDVMVSVGVESEDSLLQGRQLLHITRVEIQDDGAVTLVVDE